MARRTLKDIPELIRELTEQKERRKDLLVHSERLEMQEDGELLLKSERGITGNHRIQKQAHQQVGDKTGIHGHYYKRMLEKAPELLAHNVNYWLERADKRYLVRLLDREVRALLSDKYRPIDHLDILTIAVQVITGRDGEQESEFARGARCFDWGLTPTHMNVCLANPGMKVDLNGLEKGVQRGEVVTQEDFPGHYWLRADEGGRTPKPGEPHWVYPAARIRNSETGHGGLYIQPGIMEAICINLAWVGVDLAQRHLGKTLEMDDVLSHETIKKMNAVIFSKTADIVRSVFDPQEFLVQCKRMKGLDEKRIEITEAVDNIARLPGITEDIRNEILAAYSPAGVAGTALDVQRAVTNAAQTYSNDRVTAEGPQTRDLDKQYLLEELGGKLIREPQLMGVK